MKIIDENQLFNYLDDIGIKLTEDEASKLSEMFDTLPDKRGRLTFLDSSVFDEYGYYIGEWYRCNCCSEKIFINDNYGDIRYCPYCGIEVE